MPANQVKRTTSNLWVVVGLLVLTIASISGYKYLKPTFIATTILDMKCDLRAGACTSLLSDNREISFSISPNDIPILRPLTLTVTSKNMLVTSVKVDFVGVTMNMGYNRPTLKKIDHSHFAGKAILPVCLYSKMDWEARVLLHTNQGIIMAPFRFYTIK